MGIPPTEISQMTWPEYLILVLATIEQSDEGEGSSSIKCDTTEDFAAALMAARGRID